jgi:hypothetical protein
MNLVHTAEYMRCTYTARFIDEPLKDTNRRRQTGIKGHYLLSFYLIQKCMALVQTAPN